MSVRAQLDSASFSHHFYSVHFSCSVMSDFLRPRGLQHARLPCPLPAPRACSNHQVSDAIPSSHPLSPSSPPAFNLSQYQGLFQWLSSSHQVAKVWTFSFSISPSDEYSGLIFFRIDSFDLLVVQGTLKSLLQHHSSKASVLRCSAFFILISLLSKGLSRVFCSTTVWKHQFFGAQPSLWS